jgi:hypothetical protein
MALQVAGFGVPMSVRERKFPQEHAALGYRPLTLQDKVGIIACQRGCLQGFHREAASLPGQGKDFTSIASPTGWLIRRAPCAPECIA